MPIESRIKEYNSQGFTARFMPDPAALGQMLRPGITTFFIVRVEHMYRLVKGPVPPSRATGHSCLLITEGKARMKVGSGSYTIHKNEMLFVPAGQVFSFAPGDKNKGYLCNFHPDIFIGMADAGALRRFDFLHVWGNPRVTPGAETARHVRNLFQRMLQDYTHHGLNDPAVIQSYLLAALCEVARIYKPLPQSPQDAAVTITNRFKQLLVTSVRFRHDVAEYAGELSITPNHLAKTVKAVTGKAPTYWINEAIIREAKVLLSQSDMPVNAVAGEIGFDDPSYFARLFKRHVRVTPSAFRKKIEKS